MSSHGEGNTDVERRWRWRTRGQSHGFGDPTDSEPTRSDLRKLFSRKLGDPRGIPVIGDGSVGEGAIP